MIEIELIWGGNWSSWDMEVEARVVLGMWAKRKAHLFYGLRPSQPVQYLLIVL